MAKAEETRYGVSGFRVGTPHYSSHGSIFRDKVEVITDGYGNITGVTNREKLYRLSLPEDIEGISIDEIGKESFANCPNLEMVFLPSSIEKVGVGAFRNCPNLRVVVLSENIYQIGASAFEGCASLENINIPSALEQVGARAFYACSSIRSIHLPYDILLGAMCFSSCSGMLSFDAENVRSLPDGCLLSSGVKKLKISNKLKSIGVSALSRCTKLEEIYFDGSLSEFRSISFGMNWNKDLPSGCSLFLRNENGKFYNAFDTSDKKRRETPKEKSTVDKDLELFEIYKANPTLDEITKAYREKARKFHPDILSGLNLDKAFTDFASEQFRLYTEAYERLRKRY